MTFPGMKALRQIFIFIIAVRLNSLVLCLKKTQYDLTVIRALTGDHWTVQVPSDCRYYYRAYVEGNRCKCPKDYPNFYGLNGNIYGCFKNEEIQSECQTQNIMPKIARIKYDAFIKRDILESDPTISECELTEPFDKVHVWDGTKWSISISMALILAEFQQDKYRATKYFFKPHDHADLLQIGKYRWFVGRLVQVKVKCNIKNTAFDKDDSTHMYSAEICLLAKAMGTYNHHIRNITMPTPSLVTENLAKITTVKTTQSTTEKQPTITTTKQPTTTKKPSTTTTTMKTTQTPTTSSTQTKLPMSLSKQTITSTTTTTASNKPTTSTATTTKTAKPTLSPTITTTIKTTSIQRNLTVLTILKRNETESSSNEMVVDNLSTTKTTTSTTSRPTTATKSTNTALPFEPTTDKPTTLPTTTTPTTTTIKSSTSEIPTNEKEPSVGKPTVHTSSIIRKTKPTFPTWPRRISTITTTTARTTPDKTTRKAKRNRPIFKPALPETDTRGSMVTNKPIKFSKETREIVHNEEEFNVLMIAVGIGITTVFLIIIMVLVVLCQKYKQRHNHQCNASNRNVTTLKRSEVHVNQVNSVKKAIQSESVYAELDLRQVPSVESSYCTLQKIQTITRSYQQQIPHEPPPPKLSSWRPTFPPLEHNSTPIAYPTSDPVYMETEPYEEELYSEIPYHHINTRPGF